MDDKNIHVHIEGTEEAAHGIGKLALFAIPLVIVAAMAGLIAVAVSVSTSGSTIGAIKARANHEINQITREESAQSRADGRVGAAELPKAPVKLILQNTGPCVRWDSGYLDNGEFTGYVKNTCSTHIDYYQLFLSGLAPDGTVVQSSYNNTAFLPQLDPYDKAEIHVAIAPCCGNSMDARIVTVRARLVGHD